MSEGGDGVDSTDTELTETPAEQATSLADAVAAAAGINEERGDQVVVSQLPFDRTTADAAAAISGTSIAHGEPWTEAHALVASTGRTS